MNVRKIVETYLRSNGYDGLCNPEHECGCPLVGLSPADCITEYCVAGHAALQDDGDWLIFPGKANK
jgi:hypothetical protein